MKRLTVIILLLAVGLVDGLYSLTENGVASGIMVQAKFNRDLER